MSNSHGDTRHITMQDVEQAAKASDISRLEAAERIAAEVRRVVEERMLGSSAEQRARS